MTTPERDETPTSDPTDVRPYGDTLDDGIVQMSFTLPVAHSPEAEEAARQWVRKQGFEEPQLYHVEDLGEGYTFFIVYAAATETIDITEIEVETIETERLSFDEVNAFIRERIGRNVVMIGACTGTDAHSVGIDAIMNMKGHGGEYGLERYPMIDALNMGMQVPNEELVAEAIERDADAILVSQVVTQNDVHVENLSQLIDILEAEGVREEIIAVCGGPRIDHELALELGYDAGFGADAAAPDVASFVVQELVGRGLA